MRQVRKPGASPLVFGKFLMVSTAFVKLEDIAAYLPSYEESVIEVEMDAELGKAYAEIEQDIREAVKQNRGNRSLMSLMMHRLLLYPDHPFGIGEIWGKRFNPHLGCLEPFLVTTRRIFQKTSCMPRSTGSSRTSAESWGREGVARSMRPSQVSTMLQLGWSEYFVRQGCVSLCFGRQCRR